MANKVMSGQVTGQHEAEATWPRQWWLLRPVVMGASQKT